MITLYLISNIKTHQSKASWREILIGRWAGVVELIGFAFDLDCYPALRINVYALVAPGIRL
jgi:hypothetical protein